MHAAFLSLTFVRYYDITDVCSRQTYTADRSHWIPLYGEQRIPDVVGVGAIRIDPIARGITLKRGLSN